MDTLGTLTAEEQAELDADARAKHQRALEFQQSGFTVTEAERLASVGASVSRAREMVKRGCSHALAAEILT